MSRTWSLSSRRGCSRYGWGSVVKDVSRLWRWVRSYIFDAIAVKIDLSSVADALDIFFPGLRAVRRTHRARWRGHLLCDCYCRIEGFLSRRARLVGCHEISFSFPFAARTTLTSPGMNGLTSSAGDPHLPGL